MTAFYVLVIAFLMVSRLPVFSGKKLVKMRVPRGDGAAGVRRRGVPCDRAVDQLPSVTLRSAERAHLEGSTATAGPCILRDALRAPQDDGGYARTVAIRSVLKSGLSAEEQSKRRIDYYEYVGTGFGPRISVIQDIDGPDVGYGAFWGEVQSAVHKALGCLGVITDGSIRDIPQWAPGFQALAGSIGPSHAWVHAESFGGEVRVAGMTVRSDDLIHADSHGAIVIPYDIAAKLPEAAELCGRRETPILEIARSKDFTLEKLKDALKRSSEIH
jgi:hypothetical protein